MKTPLLYTTAIFAALFLSACTRITGPTEIVTEVSSTPAPITEYVFTADKDDVTALELMTNSVQVESKDYGSAGQFVTAINGLTADEGHYWAFYLNDEYAEKGAAQTILKQGDTIKFVYEAVTPN